MADIRVTFSGSIPEYYDGCLGPAYFDAFARDLAGRVPQRPPGAVLEIACGTGLVTRHVRERVDAATRLVATDLSEAMLAYARTKLAGYRNIEWRDADATRLPFADDDFGAVVCGFGLMFVPDKGAALAEVRRVLAAGGMFAFNVWDRVEEVPHGNASASVMERLFPGDAEIRFPLPYSMADPAMLRDLLAAAGFTDVRIATRRQAVGPMSARAIATGAVRGTPRSLLIEKRGISLDTVIAEIAAELTRIGGDPYRSHAQAIVVEAR